VLLKYVNPEKKSHPSSADVPPSTRARMERESNDDEALTLFLLDMTHA
jgi:hypothetical protein